MAIETKTVTGTIDLDNFSSGDIVETISPPSGEIWLIDHYSFRASSQTGEFNELRFKINVVQNDANELSESQLNASYFSEAGNNEFVNGDNTTAEIYVDGSTDGIFWVETDNANSMNVEYNVVIRRVK